MLRNVVTALSPKAAPFNWGQIIWHELSHVFHLQLSKGRVPRWFTEGLAEYETTLARPEWKREDDRLLYDALTSGRLPQLETMNRVFTLARTPRDLMTAYYTAFVAVKYIATRFGMERVRTMLALWGAGKSTPEVVEQALGVTLAYPDRASRRDARALSATRGLPVVFAVSRSRRGGSRAARAKNDAAAQAGSRGRGPRKTTHGGVSVRAALSLAPQDGAHFAALGSRWRIATPLGGAHLRAIIARGPDGSCCDFLCHASLPPSSLRGARRLRPRRADRRPDAWRRSWRWRAS